MDLKTGKTYASPEEAAAAGVPMADLVEVRQLPNGRMAARSVKPRPTTRALKRGIFRSFKNAVRVPVR